MKLIKVGNYSFEWLFNIAKFFLTKSVKTGNGNFSILCHSYRTNRVTDPFSISKRPSESQFCEIYIWQCQKMARKGGKMVIYEFQNFHEIFLTKSVKTGNGNFRVLCNSHRTI